MTQPQGIKAAKDGKSNAQLFHVNLQTTSESLTLGGVRRLIIYIQITHGGDKLVVQYQYYPDVKKKCYLLPLEFKSEEPGTTLPVNTYFLI